MNLAAKNEFIDDGKKPPPLWLFYKHPTQKFTYKMIGNFYTDHFIPNIPKKNSPFLGSVGRKEDEVLIIARLDGFRL